MASPRIVKAVDVLKEGRVDLPSGMPAVTPDEFGLHRLEECFDRSVVIAITLATHRDLEVVLMQPFLIFVRTILASPIGMMNASWRWLTQSNCHIQSSYREVTLQSIAHGPANDDQLLRQDTASLPGSRYN